MKLRNSKKEDFVKLPYVRLKTEVCTMDTEMFFAASPNNPGTPGGGWTPPGGAKESMMWDENEENTTFD